MSFYLKYRPKNFKDLIGQDHVRITISNAINQKNVSHAYLFSGPRGTGKTSTARLIAKALTCDTFEMENQADEGRLIDIIEIDAASNRGIDEIRDLRNKVQFAPVISKSKVFIIDEVHMLTKEAFNALLKTLEEPPNHAYFILATTEIHKVPETILSRCQVFTFKRISKNDIVKRLEYICAKENITYDIEALKIIAENAEGGLRNAISSLEQMLSSGDISEENIIKNLGIVSTQVVSSFAEELIDGKSKNALQLVQKLVHEGYDLTQFIKELLEYLRIKILEYIENDMNPNRILEVIDVIENSSQKVKYAFIPQLPLEVACIKLGYNLSDSKEKESGGFFTVLGFKSDSKKEEKIEKKSTEVFKAEKEKKEESKKEEKIAEKKELDFTIEEVKNYWSQIIEKVNSPTVKAAVKSAKIESVGRNIITLSLSTDFYFDTLKNAKGNSELIRAIEIIFGRKIVIDLQKGEKVQLTPEIDDEKEEKKDNKSSLADIASEVFR